jgi:2-iminoacetate synthase
MFAQVSMEVQPLDEKEYVTLIEEGLHSVYVYQETYHKSNYKNYHKSGKKSGFYYRLETPERLGRAGIHKTGLGILGGLEDWRTDSLFLAHHLKFLQKNFWKTKYSISFPRLRPHQGAYQPYYLFTDKDLVQLIAAYRLLDEDVELALSTRESAQFRDQLFPFGVTSMSAGSSTEPGGYNQHADKPLAQFDVSDNRMPGEVAQSIKNAGYEAVWKDWDLSYNSITK